MGLGQKPVLSQQDQTQFYGNPCPPGCPFLRLLFPCRAGAAPLGSVPSTVLQFTVPLGCHIIPCLPSGPGYRMSQKQHTFPTLLKMAQTVDAVWQAAWQAAPCYFGAVWRDHGLYARVHSVHAKGAAGSSPAHCRQLGPSQLQPSPLLWPARPCGLPATPHGHLHWLHHSSECWGASSEEKAVKWPVLPSPQTAIPCDPRAPEPFPVQPCTSL